MTYAARTASYRETEVLTAPPARLVVMLFDHLVVQLHRTRIAMENQDIALRVQSLGKARAVVGELLGTLDFEKGGAIAQHLAAMYTFMLEQMIDVGIKNDVARIAKLTFMATELRDGFQGAAAAQPADVKRSA